MRVSASIEILVQLAGQEAIAGRFKEIEPEHICLALLKFAELPVAEVDRIAPGSSAARELTDEIGALREQFQKLETDTTQARRKLRAGLGSGNTPYEGGPMHRSPACRELFDAAAKCAGEARSDALKAIHLLEAFLAGPSEHKADIMRGRQEPAAAAAKRPTPLLDKHGKDLTQLAREAQLPRPRGREPECSALASLLGQSGVRSVVLITDLPGVGCGAEFFHDVVVSLAHAAADASHPALKGRRLIDLVWLMEMPPIDDWPEAFASLLLEAGGAADVILHFDLVQAWDLRATWLDDLKNAISKAQCQFLLRLRTEANFYRKWLPEDRDLKALGWPMWVRTKPVAELPDAL